MTQCSGPGCSNLTMSLVNVSLIYLTHLKADIHGWRERHESQLLHAFSDTLENSPLFYPASDIARRIMMFSR